MEDSPVHAPEPSANCSNHCPPQGESDRERPTVNESEAEKAGLCLIVHGIGQNDPVRIGKGFLGFG